MRERKFYQYDVVVFTDLYEIPSLIDMGIKEDVEYFVSYVFNDGRCILYKEFVDKDRSKKVGIYEYMLTGYEMEHAIFLYNCLTEEQSMDAYADGDDVSQVMEVLMSSFDSLEMEFDDKYLNYCSHDFKVGDLVYFEDISRIEGFKEVKLKVGELYKIVELDKYTNAPVIKSEIGDFGIYPSELKYMYRYNDVDLSVNVDEFVGKLLEDNNDTLIALSIDEALSDRNFARVQELYNTYKK